jgi:hypothetical protein
MDEDLSSKILDIVAETNKKGIPNSSRLIMNELKKDHEIFRSQASIKSDLQKLGLHWGKGIRQNILHDSKQNVAFRLKYLKRRLDNLQIIDGQVVPKASEVFLDESYCHLDHAAAKRWVFKGDIVAEPGKKPLLVILLRLWCITTKRRVK